MSACESLRVAGYHSWHPG